MQGTREGSTNARTGWQLQQPLCLPTLEASVAPSFCHQFSSTAWRTLCPSSGYPPCCPPCGSLDMEPVPSYCPAVPRAGGTAYPELILFCLTPGPRPPPSLECRVRGFTCPTSCADESHRPGLALSWTPPCCSVSLSFLSPEMGPCTFWAQAGDYSPYVALSSRRLRGPEGALDPLRGNLNLP